MTRHDLVRLRRRWRNQTRTTAIFIAPPQQSAGAWAILRALSNKESEMSRFLLCSDEDGNDDDAQPMNTIDSAWYPLPLDPIIEIQNKQIFMLNEAYSIFVSFTTNKSY